MVKLAPGERVDRFEVERVLGRGAYGVVAVVRHRHLGSRHALKILHLSDRARAARLVREGRIQATLRHPNIVPVTDVVELEGAIGLVMEVVDGPDLHTWLARHRPSVEEVDLLAEQLFAAFAHAHAQGVVHRDVKPENVLVERQGDTLRLRLADFGLAVDSLDFDGRLTGDGTAMGTPLYMAPELYRDARSVDGRADLFGLGALLYELLAGEPPFRPAAFLEIYEAASQGRYPPLAERCPEAPGRMARAIAAALQPDPVERPADAGAMREIWRGGRPLPPGAFSPEALAAAEPPVFAEPALPTRPDSLAPPRVPSVAPDPPIRRVRSWAALAAAFLASAFLGLGGLVAVGAWMFYPRGDLAGEARSDAGEAGAGGAGPEAATPVGTEAEAQAAPAPEPVVEAAPPPPAEPTRAEPPAAPDPTPVASGPAEPARDPPATASLRVSGVEDARLLGPGGSRRPSDQLPPGDYRLSVWFAGDREPTEVMSLSLAAGERRSVLCRASLRTCR